MLSVVHSNGVVQDNPRASGFALDLLRPSVFEARQIVRARSEKPSTVATRLKEARQTGWAAALRKIHNKWRVRLCRERKELRASATFQSMATMSATWCEDELKGIEARAHKSRDAEIQELRQAIETGKVRVGRERRREVRIVRERNLRPATFLFNQCSSRTYV